MEVWEALLRLLAAGALGGAIGFEREYSDQPAGFRTHILVSLGAALFTMVGAYGLDEFTSEERYVRTDPTRIAAQVVTGIGFLGAGAILQRGIKVRGLTTAAALWVTAAIGMAAGFGYWEGAIGTAVISLVALYFLKQVGRRWFRQMKASTHLLLLVDDRFEIARFEQALGTHRLDIEKLTVRTTDEGRQIAVSLVIPDQAERDRVIDEIEALPGLKESDWRV